ncbi:MAG: DUF433 domain-containing protein [Acidobacteriia bacterium]|nr:DUF433 domain-containing protein [Terriglobia bacterium]
MAGKVKDAEIGVYGTVEVAHWLRIPARTLRTWISSDGIIVPAEPALLSFANVLELHVLKGMRKLHEVPMQRIRRAVEHVQDTFPSRHPLIDREFETDGVDIFIKDLGEYINVSRYGQGSFRDIVSTYLKRIGRSVEGVAEVLYPFVLSDAASEPELISMNPRVSFGKPVIRGTGISTALVAARFNSARESVSALAEEYGLPQTQIEEAIRWESAQPIAA